MCHEAVFLLGMKRVKGTNPPMLRVGFAVLVVLTVLLESVQLLLLKVVDYEPETCAVSADVSLVKKITCVSQGLATRYDIVPPLWAFFVAYGALVQPTDVLKHLRPSLVNASRGSDGDSLPLLVVRLVGLSAAMVTVTWTLMLAQSHSMAPSVGLNFVWGCTGTLSGCVLAMRPESRAYGVYAALTGAAVATRNGFRIRRSTCEDPSQLYSQMALSLTDDINHVASVAESTATNIAVLAQDDGARRTLSTVQNMLADDKTMHQMRKAVSAGQGVLINTTEHVDRMLASDRAVNEYTAAAASGVDQVHTGLREVGQKSDVLSMYGDATESIASGTAKLKNAVGGQNIPIEADVVSILPAAIEGINGIEKTIHSVASGDTRDGIANGEKQARKFIETSEEVMVDSLTMSMHGQVQPTVKTLQSVLTSVPDADDVRVPASAPASASEQPDGSEQPGASEQPDGSAQSVTPTPLSTSVEAQSRTTLSALLAGGSALLNPSEQAQPDRLLDAVGQYTMQNYVTPQLEAQVIPVFDGWTGYNEPAEENEDGN